MPTIDRRGYIYKSTSCDVECNDAILNLSEKSNAVHIYLQKLEILLKAYFRSIVARFTLINTKVFRSQMIIQMSRDGAIGAHK